MASASLTPLTPLIKGECVSPENIIPFLRDCIALFVRRVALAIPLCVKFSVMRWKKWAPHAACHKRMLPLWGLVNTDISCWTPHAACHKRMLPLRSYSQSYSAPAVRKVYRKVYHKKPSTSGAKGVWYKTSYYDILSIRYGISSLLR